MIWAIGSDVATWHLLDEHTRCIAGRPAGGRPARGAASSARGFVGKRAENRRERAAEIDSGSPITPSSPQPAILNLMVQYPTTVDRAFAALADPTRRAVLERLGAGSAT